MKWFKLLEHFCQIVDLVHDFLIEVIPPERPLRDVRTDHELCLRRTLRLALFIDAILEHTDALAGLDSLVDRLKLDKNGAEPLRPIVVPPILQRVQLIIVSLGGQMMAV